MEQTQTFIVRVGKNNGYICAPAGYAARADGSIYKDGTDPLKSSPEVNNRSKAYKFKSHRSAARQGNKFFRCEVIAV